MKSRPIECLCHVEKCTRSSKLKFSIGYLGYKKNLERPNPPFSTETSSNRLSILIILRLLFSTCIQSDKVMSNSDWIVIGISGVTCGGKTTLANKLKESLVPVFVFHQDHYFYPDDSPKHVKCGNLEHNNYDILSALDMETMYQDVIATMKGKNKSHAMNDMKKTGKLHVVGKKFMIIEGFTALNYRPIMEICNYRYYFILEYGQCFSRRALRLYEPPDVAGYFETCVWPEHLKYRAEIEKDDRVTIIEASGIDPFHIVLNDLKNGGANEIDN